MQPENSAAAAETQSPGVVTASGDCFSEGYNHLKIDYCVATRGSCLPASETTI